jgi:hypothetical protein
VINIIFIQYIVDHLKLIHEDSAATISVEEKHSFDNLNSGDEPNLQPLKEQVMEPLNVGIEQIDGIDGINPKYQEKEAVLHDIHSILTNAIDETVEMAVESRPKALIEEESELGMNIPDQSTEDKGQLEIDYPSETNAIINGDAKSDMISGENMSAQHLPSHTETLKINDVISNCDDKSLNEGVELSIINVHQDSDVPEGQVNDDAVRVASVNDHFTDKLSDINEDQFVDPMVNESGKKLEEALVEVAIDNKIKTVNEDDSSVNQARINEALHQESPNQQDPYEIINPEPTLESSSPTHAEDIKDAYPIVAAIYDAPNETKDSLSHENPQLKKTAELQVSNVDQPLDQSIHRKSMQDVLDVIAVVESTIKETEDDGIEEKENFHSDNDLRMIEPLRSLLSQQRIDGKDGTHDLAKSFVAIEGQAEIISENNDEIRNALEQKGISIDY